MNLRSMHLAALRGVSALTAVTGIAFLVFMATVSADPSAVSALAVLAVIGGVLVLLRSWRGARAGSETARDPQAGRLEPTELGLVETHADASTYDYANAIAEPDRLTIVLNDGRTWISVHRDRLRKRLSDPNKTTTIFLIHPESEFLPVLARKGSTDVSTLRGKIAESVSILQNIRCERSQLEILGHDLYNTYSLVLGDNSALVTPYFISRGGRTVPIYKFSKLPADGYFRDLVDDVRRLRIDARDIEMCFARASEASPSNVLPIAKGQS